VGLIAAVLDSRRSLAKPLTVGGYRVGALGQSRKLRLHCVYEPGGHSHYILGDGGSDGIPIWDHRS
jgi:hypothetical protein